VCAPRDFFSRSTCPVIRSRTSHRCSRLVETPDHPASQTSESSHLACFHLGHGGPCTPTVPLQCHPGNRYSRPLLYFRSLLLIPFQQTGFSRLRDSGPSGRGRQIRTPLDRQGGMGEPTIVLPSATRILLYIPDLIGDWLLLPLPCSLIDTV
jgi:hypothetical protein